MENSLTINKESLVDSILQFSLTEWVQNELTNDRIKLECIQQKNILHISKKKSEDNGVSLYSLQQQFSSLKTSLDSLKNNYSTVTESSLKEKGQIRYRKQDYSNIKKIRRRIDRQNS